MRRVLEYSQAFGLTPITHAEDPALSGAGVMNEGPTATRLGLTGLPAAAEETAIFRDVNLAALTGAPLHIAHVSTAGGVEIIRQAKKRGLPVTAETAPHYFTLTETSVEGYRTEAKMKPPLRSDADRAAIRAGLAEGVIDVIATDHAPHSTLEKDTLFEEAAFGVVGLETAVPLALELVRLRVLTPWQMIAALSVNPARILGVEGGALRPGRPADVVVIDPRMEWVVNPAAFQSKSRNTPFAGLTVTGRAVLTILQGKPTYRSIR
jgi:dihydroorotase